MKRRTKIELLIISVLIILLIAYWTRSSNELKEIEDFKGKTEGIIINYELVGADNHYLTYEYYVEFDRYENRLIPDKFFKDCYKSKNCIGRKFVVYYSTRTPKLSKIDLKSEIEN